MIPDIIRILQGSNSQPVVALPGVWIFVRQGRKAPNNGLSRGTVKIDTNGKQRQGNVPQDY